ncbi:MAG: ABC transporter substrate-binding protein [Candidatus Rokuibacteriota bacterium]|nr:MAG: ABC transporter substrate-binding protein [Candidatus Rokubacteria bacterium]
MSRIRGIAIWAVAVVVLAVFAGSPAQAACEPEKVSTKYPGLAGKTLKVGLDPTLPPVMYRDPKDPSKIVGQDPDMIDAAMKCLGVKYELVGLDFGTLIPTLQANQIQLVWSNIYYTPERAKAADFVAYATTGTAGIVRKGNPKKITSLADTCGVRAAPILGTVRADISMYDLVLVDQVVKSNPDKVERAFAFRTNIRIGVAVKKGNEELATAVRDAVKALQDNGTQRTLLQKNGMDPSLAIPAEILR